MCRQLSALAGGLERSAARRALLRRVGQIALSVGKNIAAYRLEQPVRGEAEAFLTAHARELAGYAMRSGDAPVMAQGLLLRCAPRGFVRLYAALTGKSKSQLV